MNHCFSRVLIKDDQGHLLVLQEHSGLLNFPGGKQEKGEHPKTCAFREVKEEVGLHVHQLTELYCGHFCFNEIQWTGHFYFADVVSGNPMLNEPDKFKAIHYINELKPTPFARPLKELIIHLSSSETVKNKTTKWI